MITFARLYKKTLIRAGIAVALLALAFGSLIYQKTQNTELFTIGASSDFPGSTWYTVNSFQGFQTKIDPSKISNGGNPNGQNTTVNNGDRISVREFGYEVLGTVTSTEDSITSLHTFRKRNGDNILMRSRGTYLEYFEEANDIWESLRTTSTDGAVYDYADYNINTDLRSYTYFGNATDPFARWTGAKTTLSAAVTAGDATISIVDGADLTATGTIRYCDTDATYTSKTDTVVTLTGTAPVSCASGRGITQAVEEFPSNPRGNIYLVSSNRIFIAGVTSTPQAVYFSTYGNATTYLTTLISDSTADAAGIFNLGEGGGAVTGMAQDEGAVYITKRSIIYKATLSDSLYTLTPLKPFDGKSQTTGAVKDGLVFTGGNGVYFVTPDNQIMNLTRIESVDYPQMIPISDIIKPTVDSISFTNGSGISWKDKAYFSAKSDPNGAVNDIVLVWNERTNQWDSPTVGWSASDWTIYDDGTGEELYFGDSNTANVYKITTDEKLDNGFSFTSSWRSKQFTFSELGIPIESMAELNSVYIEGYITENTTLNISLFLDEQGVTQEFSTTLSGTDTDYIFSAEQLNPFGLHPFGFLPFGSSDASSKKKFRVYLNKSFRPVDLYNLQIEFLSEGENDFWEVTSFGFKVKESTQPEKRTLFKAFQ